MADRLSYTDFKREFILQFAVLVEGDTAKSIDPSELLPEIEGRFPASWIQTAVKDCSDDGLISGITYISGEGTYKLTGKGLREAEQAASYSGADIYELMDEAHSSSATEGFTLGEPSQGYTIGESGGSRIIKADDGLGEAFKALDREIEERVIELRGNNQVMAEGGAESSQRLSELEAGRRLLGAEQVDVSLLERLLIPSLTWFGKTVADQTARDLIQKLIRLVWDFVGKAG